MGQPMTRIRLDYVHEYRDRHGKVRRYFRKGGRRVALPGSPGSADFMRAYQMAVSGKVAPPIAFEAGTLGDLIVRYYKSQAFGNLKPSSKVAYRRVLETLPASDRDRTVAMPRQAAEQLVSEIGHTPAMANLRRAVLGRMYAWGVTAKLVEVNPFIGIEPYKIGTRHTWTEGEIALYEKRWKIGTRERLAFDLLLYTGQRVGDVARMSRADIERGAIRVVQEKTGAELMIPLHPQVLRSLKAWGARGVRLIGRDDGRAIRDERLSVIVMKAAAKAGLPGRCKPHGLRKAMMRRLAESGESAKRIAAISGHRTLKEIERYTAAADQVQLAQSAIASLANPRKG